MDRKANMRLYHIPINSMYIELVRCRYRGKDYSKWEVKYYSKASGILIAHEKSVKVRHGVMKHWQVWDESLGM